jgi:hypothetical protein
MRGRVDQPREQLAVVGADVAVVHRDHAREVGREHVPEREPGAAALARRARREPLAFEPVVERLHARAAVPEQDRRRAVDRAHAVEQRAHVLVLGALRVGARDRDDDLAQVGDAAQRVDDALEPGPVQLA